MLSGLFGIVQRLYGIQIHELEQFDGWHPDVRLFEITENGEHVGLLRPLRAAEQARRRRMDGARDKRRTADGTLQTPVANRSATSPRRWASARRS